MEELVDDRECVSFDQRYTVFERAKWDRSAAFYRKRISDKIGSILLSNGSGYDPIEYARHRAARAVYNRLGSGFAREEEVWGNTPLGKILRSRISMKDPGVLSLELKETALRFGADLVGIAKIDPRWFYSRRGDGTEIVIPEGYRFVIVMAVGMNPDRIMRSPGLIASTETGLGYSKMVFVALMLTDFIRYLGYRAIPFGNDTALSIPMAIDAGMGRLGRNGLLITDEYGPCVRLCKVITDLPIVEDRRGDGALREECRDCIRCAESCEAGAISFERDPSFKTVSRSNNRGIKRWAVNPEKCYEFWVKNGADCSNCISACPMTPR